MFLNRVSQLRVFGARYAAEFSGKARVRRLPPTPDFLARSLHTAAAPAKFAHRTSSLRPPCLWASARASEHVRLWPAATANTPHFFARRPIFFLRAEASPDLSAACPPSAAQQLGIQMSVEATLLGTVMAVWWRISHNAEKAKYDKYYANLRSQVAAAEEE